jgi:mono/diheme cytochrome c family protein
MRARIAIIAMVCASVAAVGDAAAAEIELPQGPGRDLVYAKCRTCHDLQYLKESAGIPRDAWEDLLTSMRQYGLSILPDQQAKILDYLGTYLGPNPPPAGAAPAQAPGGSIDGAAAFADNCSSCHQEDGQGVPGQFPPFAGNKDLFLARDFPVKVALFGLEGKIQVAATTYQGVMPPFGHLDDAHIAAIVNYIRSSWGNAELAPADMAKVDEATVKAARESQLTPAAVHAYRKNLKAKP